MKKIFVISTIAIILTTNEASSPFSSSSGIIDVKKAVTYLNNIPDRTWTAGPNGFGRFLRSSEMQVRAGVQSVGANNAGNPNTPTVVQPELPEIFKHLFLPFDIPDNYDARTMFPHCTTISSIKDQSNCGSCWAISTASVFSDRLCIKSQGLINVNISSNHLLACATNNGYRGCKGYSVGEAWIYIKEHGAITGGDFQTFDGCQPYEISPCGGKGQFECQKQLTPKCRATTCTNEYYESSRENKIYTISRALGMLGNETHPCWEKHIRSEIYRNGPVVATIAIYEPLYFYKRGIFQIDTNNLKREGYHAVRIIGWGIEDDIPYWIVANSWGRIWGDDGILKIVRGKNHCFIESTIEFGVPIIPRDISEQLK